MAANSMSLSLSSGLARDTIQGSVRRDFAIGVYDVI